MKLIDTVTGLFRPRDPGCPDEADVLAFSENTIPTNRRNNLQRHFSQCTDCQETLAFLGRETVDPVAITNQEASLQTDRVLSYIQKDARTYSPSSKKREFSPGFHMYFPRFASVGLIICAIAAGFVFIVTRGPAASDEAMQSLKQGLKDTRLSEARISGGFDYSRYIGQTRGVENNNDDFYLTRAENKVRPAAEKESNGIENRMVLARVYLARGTRTGAAQALTILNQLGNAATENAEVLNDMGVARLQQSDYQTAIDYFTRALAKSPSYDEALFNLALAEQFDNRTEDARRDWQRFIQQSSDDRWKAEARNRLSSLGGSTH
jgi:tetratricopeptide (TPR) repeat protein